MQRSKHPNLHQEVTAMSAAATLDSQPRTAHGKSATLTLRKAGRIPAVLYGGGSPATLLSFAAKDVTDHLRHHSRNAVIDVMVNGTARRAVIKDLDIHPVSRRLRHVDLLELHEDRRVVIDVPLQIEGGDPVGVRQGGILQVVRDRVKLSCAPSQIPEAIPVNLSALDAGQTFTAAELPIDVTDLLIPADTVLFKIVSPRVGVAAAAAGEEEGEGEEEEAAEATE
ncbi:MAG: 50S ribosomal protein L25 [Nitrospirota bacterium]